MTATMSAAMMELADPGQPSVVIPSRTLQETEEYYDKQQKIYLDVWDKDGRICWGVYENEKSTFKEAGLNHVERMAEKAGIGAESVVLDLGCGHGINTYWLAERCGCKVVGLDVSGEMIRHCENQTAKHPSVAGRVSFVKGTVDEKKEELLGLKLTHIWSNAVIYQIHYEARMALWSQLASVLQPGGRLVFDDATCPNGVVQHEESKRVFYDRLHLEKLLDPPAYHAALSKAGFSVELEEDISSHFKRSYEDLARAAKEKGYSELGADYEKSATATERGDVGWHLFVAKLSGVAIPSRTLQETEEYYDKQQQIYLDVWDKDGRICWGVYENEKSTFKEAGLNHVERMVEKAGIGAESVVLDLGCGHGINTYWLAERCGCKVVGLDVSGEMIRHCENQMAKHPSVAGRVSFVKGTVDEKKEELLGLKLTHIWSNAVIYQIHYEARMALWSQLASVLQPGGRLVFDDATCPNGVVQHEESKRVFYDRLHLEKLLDPPAYHAALSKAGFSVELEEDISSHFKRSYEDLARAAKEKGYSQLGADYEKSATATERGDVGWHLFVAKLSGSSSIVGQGTDPGANQKLYDDWAAKYEEDVRKWGYDLPEQVAKVLAPHATSEKVLDAGAGDGLSGIALAQVGFTAITGMDLSPELVKIAEQRKVYTDVVVGDLSKPLPYETGEFALSFCIGVMTYLDPSAQRVCGRACGVLSEFCRVVKPGGIVCCTHRTDKVELWAEEIERLEAEGVWTKVEVHGPLPYLPNNPEFADKIQVLVHVYRVN